MKSNYFKKVGFILDKYDELIYRTKNLITLLEENKDLNSNEIEKYEDGLINTYILKMKYHNKFLRNYKFFK